MKTVWLGLFLVFGFVGGGAVAAEPKVRAIAFDAFPIFDPRPVEAAAVALFPEQGRELTKSWRTRQFEYQWLRALGGEDRDFKVTTEDALTFAARQHGLELSGEARQKLMAPYASLTAWPDARAALEKLKEKGYRLVFLSNMTEEMLRSGLAASGLAPYFDAVYSTDAVRTFKPAPKAYQMALDGLGLPREEVLFVAFAGWDAAGAKWFGYPTFWLNRAGAPAEELGTSPDGMGRDLQALIDFLEKR